jgi:chorismate mutase/prephenate dehydratase
MLLEKLRQDIDKLDSKIVELLNERARLSLEILKEKQKSNLPIHNQKREQQVIQNAIRQNEGPLTSEQIKIIFQIIVESCRTIQQRQKGM